MPLGFSSNSTWGYYPFRPKDRGRVRGVDKRWRHWWPKEIEDSTTLTSAGEGKALPIATARIKIWHDDQLYIDMAKVADPDSDGVQFSIKNLPKGSAFIQTWFYDDKGEMTGAVYYNYAKLEE